VPLEVPLLDHNCVPAELVVAAKYSTLFIATGGEAIVALKLMAVRLKSARPSRLSTRSRQRTCLRPVRAEVARCRCRNMFISLCNAQESRLDWHRVSALRADSDVPLERGSSSNHPRLGYRRGVRHAALIVVQKLLDATITDSGRPWRLCVLLELTRPRAELLTALRGYCSIIQGTDNRDASQLRCQVLRSELFRTHCLEEVLETPGQKIHPRTPPSDSLRRALNPV
jgi:hypothetical protein